MSQTVYAVYWKYEYCIYLKKPPEILDINMYARLAKLALGCLRKSAWCRTRKMHVTVHVKCMSPSTYVHEAVHVRCILRIFLIFSYQNSILNLKQYVFESI